MLDGHQQQRADKFLQKGAVTETLLAHCQSSMPLLKVFPLKLQRAILGNVVSLVSFVVSDAVAGFQLRLLGHQLTASFTPMSDEEAFTWLRSTAVYSRRIDGRRAAEFEVAVRELAAVIDNDFKVLQHPYERWVRKQLATLIARLALTLVDDALGGCKFDLWPAGGGPRILAGIEFRVPEVESNK